MKDNSRYYFCKLLDQDRRIIGLPSDEAIPLIACFLIFFLIKQLVMGFIVAAIILLVIRYFKRGQGSTWLINLCYWYCPASIMKLIFSSTPLSYYRHWLG